MIIACVTSHFHNKMEILDVILKLHIFKRVET